MFGYLNYADRDASRRERAVKIFKGLSRDVRDYIEDNPVKSVLAGTTLAAGLVWATSLLHDHNVAKDVTAQLKNQTSHQATTTSFGIHQYGTIFNGVAVRNVKQDDRAGNLINETIRKYAPSSDEIVGCKTTTLTTDKEKSNLLSHVFGGKATVAIFNNPAFDNSSYSCQVTALEPSIPRPLRPEIPALGTSTQSPYIRNMI